MITRFAPSPTGYMHIGNVRTALVCWLYARKERGKFLLRIDDTDLDRSDEKYVDALKRDLEWLSMDWDFCFNQRSRMDRYDEVFNLLLARGVIYPCYETQEELEIKRSTMLKRGLPPIYDRSALRMTEHDLQACSGKKPHFRFKIDDSKSEISWDDEIRGRVAFKVQKISDPIVRRENGSYTYMLPSAVDDVDFAITHIVRGEDHISNTAVQICIMDMLGAKIPKFSHLSLMYDGDAKLSKRVGGTEINSLREMGIEPMAITSYLARIGTSLQVEPQVEITSLLEKFDIKLFSKAPLKFSCQDILRINAGILHILSFEQAREKLELLGINCSEKMWYTVRDNINVITDVKKWVEICGPGVVPVIHDKDKDMIELAKDLLPQGDPDDSTWKIWLQRIQERTNLATRDILLPLRLALTGISEGPGLAKLLQIIGRDEALRRLSGDDAPC